jgi:hypothetical protein
MRARAGEPDELSGILVPEREPQAAEAVAQRQPAHRPEHLVSVQAFLEPVVWDAAVQVIVTEEERLVSRVSDSLYRIAASRLVL